MAGGGNVLKPQRQTCRNFNSLNTLCDHVFCGSNKLLLVDWLQRPNTLVAQHVISYNL